MHTTRFKMILSLVTAATLALPAFSADEPAKAGGKPEVKVTVNGKKYIGDSPTIIIPTVYLKLAVSGKVSATKQASGLSLIGSSGGGNTVKAKAQYAVEGLEKKFAQELAQKVHDDLVAQLKAAGFTVKTYADVKDVEGMKAAKRETADKGIGMPTAKDGLGSTVLATAAPSDEQVFKTGLAWGVFNQFVTRTKSVLGEGTVLIPTYTIAAPQAWAETSSGYKSISAGVNVAPGMNLTHASAEFLTEKAAGGSVMTKAQVINIGEKVGEISAQDTTPETANAISSALSSLTGAGSISSKSGYYKMTIDTAAYEAGVLRGCTAFNAEVAKAAADALKK